MKKVVIIDDESAGRRLIREYLRDFIDWNIVGEASNGPDAVKLIQAVCPDLAFLDIQMPGMTGFEVITQLTEIPRVIFSTAYDQYAIKAFEVHAVDYLLKPYTKDRFKDAMSRVIDYPSTHTENLMESLLVEKNAFPERILVQSGKRLIMLKVLDIIRIEADGDYSKLVTAQTIHLSNYGISKLEKRLNPEIFIRVHRSSMVNLNFVQSINKYLNSFDVLMTNSDVVRVSRGYMDRIKNLIF